MADCFWFPGRHCSSNSVTHEQILDTRTLIGNLRESERGVLEAFVACARRELPIHRRCFEQADANARTHGVAEHFAIGHSADQMDALAQPLLCSNSTQLFDVG